MKKLTLAEAKTQIASLKKQLSTKISECNSEVYACKKSCNKTFYKGLLTGAAAVVVLSLIIKLFS